MRIDVIHERPDGYVRHILFGEKPGGYRMDSEFGCEKAFIPVLVLAKRWIIRKQLVHFAVTAGTSVTDEHVVEIMRLEERGSELAIPVRELGFIGDADGAAIWTQDLMRCLVEMQRLL